MTYKELFIEIAQTYDLNWRLLAEQAWQESRLDPLAIGPANDMGILQIIPRTWGEWAPRLGVVDPFDAYSNVLVGAACLAFLRDDVARFGAKDFHWALLAYKWGVSNVRDLLEDGGQWQDVPAAHRDYAISIVLRADVHSLLHRMTGTPGAQVAAAHGSPASGPVADRNEHLTLAELLTRPIPITETTPPTVQRRGL